MFHSMVWIPENFSVDFGVLFVGFGSNVDIDYLLPKEMQYDLHISCQCFTSNLITLSDFTKYRNLAFYPHT